MSDVLDSDLPPVGADPSSGAVAARAFATQPPLAPVSSDPTLPARYEAAVQQVQALASSGTDLEQMMLSQYRERLHLAEELGRDSHGQMDFLINKPDMAQVLENDLHARTFIQSFSQYTPTQREELRRDVFGADLAFEHPNEEIEAVSRRLKTALADPTHAPSTAALAGYHASLAESVLVDPTALTTLAWDNPRNAEALLAHRFSPEELSPQAMSEARTFAAGYMQSTSQETASALAHDPAGLAVSRREREELLVGMMQDPRRAFALGLEMLDSDRTDETMLLANSRRLALLGSDMTKINPMALDPHLVDSLQQNVREELDATFAAKQINPQDLASRYVWLSQQARDAEVRPYEGPPDGDMIMKGQIYHKMALEELNQLAIEFPGKAPLRIHQASNLLGVSFSEAGAAYKADLVDASYSGRSADREAPTLDRPSLWADRAVAEPQKERGAVGDIPPPLETKPTDADMHVDYKNGYASFNRRSMGKDDVTSWDLIEKHISMNRFDVDKALKDPETPAFALPMNTFGMGGSGNVSQPISKLMKTEEGREQVMSLLEGTRNMRDKIIGDTPMNRLSELDKKNHDRLELGYRAILMATRSSRKSMPELESYYGTTTPFVSDEAKEKGMNEKHIYGFLEGRDLEKDKAPSLASQTGDKIKQMAGQHAQSALRTLLSPHAHAHGR